MSKKRAPRNKTLTLSSEEAATLSQRLLSVNKNVTSDELNNRTILGDLFEILDYLPLAFVDLLIVDPPYNLTKTFNQEKFKQMPLAAYEDWLESWFAKLVHTVKPTGSIYICGDWQSSTAIQRVMSRYCTIRNRITWEREKGRGASANWKNSSEDIWFGTMSNDYTFNVNAVKLKRRVIAPYTSENGTPKDWGTEGDNRFRLTHPANLWNDITVPFWSMPENTEHPTQKPEKLLAKLILASSNKDDLVFDPFLGSGTTSVTAKKLGRRYAGIELDSTFAYLAEKRLALAETDSRIQGYADGVFWERNTLNLQNKKG